MLLEAQPTPNEPIPEPKREKTAERETLNAEEEAEEPAREVMLA